MMPMLLWRFGGLAAWLLPLPLPCEQLSLSPRHSHSAADTDVVCLLLLLFERNRSSAIHEFLDRVHPFILMHVSDPSYPQRCCSLLVYAVLHTHIGFPVLARASNEQTRDHEVTAASTFLLFLLLFATLFLLAFALFVFRSFFCRCFCMQSIQLLDLSCSLRIPFLFLFAQPL